MRTSKKYAIAGAGIAGAVLGRELWKRAALRARNRSIPRGRRILILGAGFGGMHVARKLACLLPSDSDAQITLVDRNNFLLFTPMLTEVAGGELEPRHIVASPRQLSSRVDFEQATVHDIDLTNKAVVMDLGSNGNSRRTLTADHLVIALGSVPEYHDIPGLREHSLSIKSVSEASEIRNRVLASLERANGESDPNVRREILSFVVGGGGYTGVETMAAINDLARGSVKEYPHVRPEEISTTIAEPGDRLLPEISAGLAEFARQKLEQHGVRVLLKTKVASAAEDHVQIEPGGRISTRTLIWAGGVKPNPLIASLNCERGKHGGVVVDENCEVKGHPGVWALGDCAEVPDSHSKSTYAPTAQNATHEGSHVARNIVAVLRGQKPRPFRYEPIGELALVGRHSAVAKIYGRQFSGFLAWAMWRAVYLSKVPGMDQRSRILLDWILDAIFGRSIAEVPAERSAIV